MPPTYAIMRFKKYKGPEISRIFSRKGKRHVYPRESKDRPLEPADINGSEVQNSVPRYSCLTPCPNPYNAPHSHLAGAPKIQESKGDIHK